MELNQLIVLSLQKKEFVILHPHHNSCLLVWTLKVSRRYHFSMVQALTHMALTLPPRLSLEGLFVETVILSHHHVSASGPSSDP